WPFLQPIQVVLLREAESYVAHMDRRVGASRPAVRFHPVLSHFRQAGREESTPEPDLVDDVGPATQPLEVLIGADLLFVTLQGGRKTELLFEAFLDALIVWLIFPQDLQMVFAQHTIKIGCHRCLRVLPPATGPQGSSAG